MGVLWLSDVDKNDIPMVGGKAANLGELLRLGIPVPDGFVIDGKTYLNFLEGSGLKEKIMKILKSVNVEDTKQLEEASKKIRELIENTPMPKDVEDEIRKAYRRLCEEEGEEVYVAVRSSATAEDLPDASFAGQQETYLNVKGEEEVVSKVKKCWSSLFTPRAIFYRVQKGFKHGEVSIAVIVQKMVNSEKSGVMFTSHPVTGDKISIIEAVWGLGEAIVSGKITPDHYEYDRINRKITVVKIAEKKLMITRQDDKTIEIKLDEKKAKERVLSDKEIEELVKIGEIIEEHYECPQDIEWAIEKGKIYILQTRPITT
ncbi:MAG TPA: phosphoenolpyruvate synthase, partial [Archaeoglobus profundus]|nr:phosphoenolpyruvate synthase [Archaeoglobus profundus]